MKHKNGGNMSASAIGNNYFGTERIGKILLRIAPPVMLAQLIQSLYNIVDSFFVGKYSDDALTALTVVYPLQLIIVALAVGTGVGVNTYMARKYAQEREKEANGTASAGLILALVSWAIFAAVSALIMRPYVMTSAKSPQAIEDAVIYGNIVCIGSLGAFLEGIWSKVHQSRGNMRLPMIAQVAGALTNIALDPLMIFGIGPFPEMGVAGAAYATVLGQVVSAVIVGVKGFRRPPAACDFPHYANRIYFLRLFFHHHASALYGLYRRAEYDTRKVFRLCRYGTRTLLQDAELFLHPAYRAGNLYCSRAELQLYKKRVSAMPRHDECFLCHICCIHGDRYSLLLLLPAVSDKHLFIKCRGV